MGLLDNFIKGLDNIIDEAESGKLEKRLSGLADKLEHTTDKVIHRTEALADKPKQALDALGSKSKQIETKVSDVKGHVAKSIDIIQKKD
jgi:hypothetical protein